MSPVILELGPVTIYSFGLIVLVSVLLGLFVSWKKAKEYHLETEEFFDVAFGVVWWGLVGARVWYIVEHVGVFGLSPLKWLWFTRYVGLSMWGAVLGGALSLGVMAWRRRKDVFGWLDLGGVGASWGLGLGRMAILLNELEGGIRIWRVPLALMEMLLLVLLGVWLWRLEKIYRMFAWYRGGRGSARSGFLWFVFLIGLGLSLLLGVVVEGLRVGRVMGMVSISIGLIGLYWRSGRNLKQDLSLGDIWR